VTDATTANASKRARAAAIVQLDYLPVPNDYRPRPDPGPVLRAPDQPPLGWLAENGAEAEVVITNSLRGMTAAEVAAFPKLKLIACFGGSVDRVAVREAQARGIAVTATPDMLSNDAADLVMCQILMLFRDIPHADRYTRAGQWIGDFPYARSVRGRKLGLYGFGRIGRAVATRAAVFGMEIGVCKRAPVKDPSVRAFTDVEAMARWCDVLVIAAAATPETVGSVNAAVLKALGADGFLINVARGSIVDEAALIEALKGRTIAGAALDVYAKEPLHDSPLRGLDNVILTPHIASATRDTRTAMADRVYANIAAFRAGSPLEGLVSPIISAS
jgi:lactate dehydrogenase-like 2-hydroxyacid dehydrogenase